MGYVMSVDPKLARSVACDLRSIYETSQNGYLLNLRNVSKLLCAAPQSRTRLRPDAFLRIARSTHESLADMPGVCGFSFLPMKCPKSMGTMVVRTIVPSNVVSGISKSAAHLRNSDEEFDEAGYHVRIDVIRAEARRIHIRKWDAPVFVSGHVVRRYIERAIEDRGVYDTAIKSDIARHLAREIDRAVMAACLWTHRDLVGQDLTTNSYDIACPAEGGAIVGSLSRSTASGAYGKPINARIGKNGPNTLDWTPPPDDEVIVAHLRTFMDSQILDRHQDSALEALADWHRRHAPMADALPEMVWRSPWVDYSDDLLTEMNEIMNDLDPIIIAARKAFGHWTTERFSRPAPSAANLRLTA
jgi:hypothetical protein